MRCKGQVDADVWIARLKANDERNDEVVRNAGTAVHAPSAVRVRAGAVRLALAHIDSDHDVAGTREIALAGLGQPHESCSPVQRPDTEVAFESGNRATHLGGSEVKPPARLCERPCVGECDEGLHAMNQVHRHCGKDRMGINMPLLYRAVWHGARVVRLFVVAKSIVPGKFVGLSSKDGKSFRTV